MKLIDKSQSHSEDGTGGTQAEPQQIQPYSQGFWSPLLKQQRAMYFKILAASVSLTTIAIWGFLTVYWASIAHETGRLVQINAVFVNRDIANGVNGTLGNTVRETVFQSLNQTHHLGWTEEPSSKVPTRASIEQALVEDEWAWVFLVVGENATQNLTIARENGISTYNPRDAITIYYNQARNELASGKILPIAQQIAQQSSQQASVQTLEQYLTQQSGNATAMANLATAPQTAGNAFGITTVDFRPFDQAVASAVVLVGLIYLTLLAFIQTMANFGARPIMEKYLKLSSYIGMRILVPLCLYVVIALLFTMLNLPWDVHFDAHFSNTAKGFFCTYALFLVGMSALGLATEVIITVVGPKFMPYALVALIIANVSVAAVPPDLQVWFFKYYPAMVYYHLNRGVRCIIFNIKNELGLNFGVCLAWVVFSVCTLSGFTALFRHLDIKKAKKEAEEQQGEHKA